MRGHCILLFVAFIFAAAEVGAVDSSQRAQIVVGSELDYPPYALVAADGQADGFSVDLMKAVCEVMGIKATFRVGPWNEVRKALEDGEVDALPLVSYSAEREKVFDFTAPHTASYAAVFKRKGSPDIDSVEDMRGKSIIAMQSDATHDWLQRNNISETLALTKTVAETLRLLASGKHDYALAPRLVGLLTAKELGLTNIEITGPRIDAYGRGFGFAVKEGDSALLSQLNQGLAIIKETGRYDEIYEKWFGIVDPKGIQTDVIIRYLTWGMVGVIILVGLPLGWSIALQRKVKQRTKELNDEIGERKQAEERLRQAHGDLELKIKERTKELDISKTKAEAASVAKSEFLSHMSHELRSPLNAIIGFSDTMRLQIFGKLGNPKYDEYTENIHESGRHLLELIDDILDLSVIEAGVVELDEADVDVTKLIDATTTMVRPRAEKALVKLSIDVPKDRIRIRGDDRRLKQIVINLLTNAIKFTPERGEVSVSIRIDQDESLLLAVKDNGIGIAPENIENVKSPFGQVESALSRKNRGVGLGLSLCIELAKLHDGTLDIDSALGKGTTVTVRFPPERVVSHA